VIAGVDQTGQTDARIKIFDGPAADDGGHEAGLAREKVQGIRGAGVQPGRGGIFADRHQGAVEIQKE
jgi:hypothetical protein